MSDIIPPELIMKILSRVPAEPILCFRCVCKAWCHMIDDPYFVKIHNDYHLFKINDDFNDVGYLVVNHDSKICFLSLDFRLKFETASMKPNPFLFNQNCIASCNGLILLCNYQSKYSWSIWNPLTEELHVLPILHEVWNQFETTSGFGYDSVSDDYKVLRQSHIYINEERSYRFYTSVYSLRSDSWKRLDNFPYLIEKWASGVFLNGALHWVSALELIIIVFDLETEYCRIYPLFSFMQHNNEYNSFDLVEMDGCLSLSLHCGERLEVWLMKDYGVESSWTRLFLNEEMWLKNNYGAHWRTNYTSTTPPRNRILSYWKSKGLVLFWKDNKGLFWFNLVNNIVKNVSVPENLKNLSSQMFRPSLVRINQ